MPNLHSPSCSHWPARKAVVLRHAELRPRSDGPDEVSSGEVVKKLGIGHSARTRFGCWIGPNHSRVGHCCKGNPGLGHFGSKFGSNEEQGSGPQVAPDRPER